jgi:hypothetical protein
MGDEEICIDYERLWFTPWRATGSYPKYKKALAEASALSQFDAVASVAVEFWVASRESRT